MKGKLIVDGGCTFCGTCILECPAGAVYLDEGGAHIDHNICTGCGICRDNCASEAITFVEDMNDAG